MTFTPTRQRSLRCLVALMILAAACGSDDDRALRIIKGAAIKDGVVTGFVIDDETEVPVPAEVLVGGTPVRAQANGSFEAPATAGRVRVEVRSEGYLKSFRDVAVGGRSLPMPFKVAKRAPKQVVGQAGGRFTYREAILEVPAGAFAGDTGLSLTHLSRVRVAAIAATPQFIDEQGIPRRAVALVDLTSDQQPSMAVRARVPVPTDSTMDNISGFVIDGAGNWTTPISPDTVGGGFAEFVLAGDLQIGVAIDVRRGDSRKIGYLVTDRGGTASAQGDVLASGEIVTGMRAAAIVDPQGSRVEMAAGTRARVEVPSETATASRAPYAGTVVVSAGRARAVVAPPAADDPKLIKLTVKGNAGQFDVKGTAFTVTTCGFAPNVVDVLEVSEGLVTASAGKESKDIAAGETATVCTDCSPATVGMCTPPGEDGGAGPVPGDGGARSPDVAAPGEGGAAPGPDAGVTDAAAGGNDGSTTGGDTASAGPDAPVMVPPDAAAPPDGPVLMPDAATLMPDTARLMPDSAVLMPDAAVIEPDVAQPMPDTAPPADAAAPSLDMAFDSASIPADATMAIFAISPGTQDFGSVTLGQMTAAVNFTITNNGDLPSDTPTVAATNDFSVSTNGCINALPSKTSCVVGVIFRPTVAGSRTGALNVTTSDGLTSSAFLTGTGVAPTPGQFRLTPLSHNFGYRQMNRSSGDLIFVLSNSGQQPTGVPRVAFGGTNPTEFGFNPAVPRMGPCPTALQPGGTCNIPVRFVPRTAGTGIEPKSATLVIDGSPGGTVSANLNGIATLAENGLELSPPHFDLLDVPVGGSKDATFTLTNIGTLAIRNVVVSITALQPRPPEWTVKSGCPITLVPQETCTAVVTFTHGSPTGLREIVLRAAGEEPVNKLMANAAAHVQATAQ